MLARMEVSIVGDGGSCGLFESGNEDLYNDCIYH